MLGGLVFMLWEHTHSTVGEFAKGEGIILGGMVVRVSIESISSRTLTYSPRPTVAYYEEEEGGGDNVRCCKLVSG